MGLSNDLKKKIVAAFEFNMDATSFLYAYCKDGVLGYTTDRQFADRVSEGVGLWRISLEEISDRGDPDGIEMGRVAELLRYSDRYEIAIHFGPDRAVFVEKEGKDVQNFYGEQAIESAVKYMKKKEEGRWI